MILLNDLELDLALALLPADLVLRVRMLIAEGWTLEAKRLLEEVTGGREGAEIFASMIRRMVN
jgi:hypothetical protein